MNAKVKIIYFKPFLANVSILYPLKTLKQRFFGVFRGFKMETLAKNLRPPTILK